MSLDISIDHERCIGSANCQFWAPGVFDLNDDDKAFVVDAQAQPRDKILGAADGCPTRAITVSADGQRLAGG